MKKKNRQKFLVALGGVFVGAINGFFASGGGMLAVPIFEKFGKIENRKAHATAVLTMLPICVVSAIGYFATNTVDYSVLWPVMAGTIAGGIVGTVLLSKLKNSIISVIFGVLMLFAGIVMII